MRRTQIAALTLATVLGGVLPLSAAQAAPEAAGGRPPGDRPGGHRVTCAYLPTPENPAARPVRLPAPKARTRGHVEVTLVTNHGDITLRLHRANAPCAVHSVVHLVEQTFYDRSRCWRLTAYARLGVLQCGDIWEAEVGGPGYRFADELTGAETYPRGTVAMGNVGPDTNGSQFFIVQSVAQIKPDYTVLGTVVDGMDVVDRIAAGGIRPEGSQDGQPRLPVEIREAIVD